MFISQYKADEGNLLLEDEESLVPTLEQESRQSQLYSPETNDWLLCQKLLNHFSSMALNGDLHLSMRCPTDWIYRFVYPEPTFWHGPSLSVPAGPYTGRIHKYLGGKKVTLHDLYAALKEAEQFLFEPPNEILTETRHCIIQERPSHTAFHPVVHDMRRILSHIGDDVSVYLHGSMATGDYTPFSDVDDLVIVHQKGWSSYTRFRQVVRALENVATLFQRIDALQHHGHWIYLDCDMACLDQSSLPLVVLKDSVIVVGRPEVRANLRLEDWGLRRVLWDTIQDVRHNASAMARGKLNLYGLKNLVSGISLLPPLVFQVNGKMLDKKTAILRSSNIFSDKALVALHWSTKIRETWASCHGYTGLRMMGYLNCILPFRRNALEAIARRCLPPLRTSQIPFLTDEVVKAIFQLSNECAHQLREVMVVNGIRAV
jgi:predicted nucleotidyltransferase